MRVLRLLALALCLVPVCCGSVFADQILTFVSEEWAGRTNADGTGFYWDLLRAIYQPAGYTLKFSVLPYARAVKTVVDGQAHAWVASYPDEERVVYPHTSFDVDQVVGVFRKGTVDSTQGQKALEGRKVGWIQGYNFDEYLDVAVIKDDLSSRESGLRMVERGRLDVYLDAADDIEHAFDQGAADRAQLDTAPFLELKLYMAFQNGETGRVLAQIFDERMRALHESGELRTLYATSPRAQYPF